MLTGLVAADVRPDRRYWWRVTLLGRFHRSVAGSLRAVYVQSGHRQQPGVRRGRLGATHQTAGGSGRPASRRHARKLTRGNGRWEAKVFVDTPEGRRKRMSVYGDTEQEALNELNKLRDQQRRGIPVATTTLTVSEYMTYWLEQIAEPSIRRTTYATYEDDIRLHIIPGIGKRKLKSLQAAHIRTWLNDLRTTCQCCVQGRDDARKTARCCALSSPKCCKAVLSASSIRHILRVLRAALQDAVDEELLSRNVARLVQLRVTDERRVRSFSRDEALRFLAAAEEHRLYALWAVALAMGLRRGEALGLAWADVDLDGGV
jgi:hypothetical protein